MSSSAVLSSTTATIPSPSPTPPPTSPSSLTFISVRDESALPRQFSFQEALTSGYAPDGGMMLPSTIPALSTAALQSLRSCPSYQALLVRLLQLFVDSSEVSPALLPSLIGRAFQSFQRPSPPSPLCLSELSYTQLRLSCAPPLTVLNLYHGPTLTFKDVALQPLASLLSHLSSSSPDRPLHIVVGTSGDTGSAAIAAVSSLPHTHLYVLYPKGGRISRLQELQMITCPAANVHVVAVDGSSDELDVPIKEVLDDAAFQRSHQLCSINSINIGRILMQTAHICHAALLLPPTSPSSTSSSDASSPSISLSLPCGALGHLVAALLCRRMGLPIRRVLCATNRNDCVARFIHTGLYRPSPSVHVTSSCAMDISAAYNVERVLHLLQRGPSASAKAARVNACLASLAKVGEFQLLDEEMAELRGLGVRAHSVGEDEVQATMRRVWGECGELIDPHTAVGVAAAAQLLTEVEEGERVVCVATAHPAKFEEAVQAATGESREGLRKRWAVSTSANIAATQQLEGKDTHYVEWSRDTQPLWAEQLRALIAAAAAAAPASTAGSAPFPA